MRLIDGNYAGSDKVIARCHLLKHRGYLSKNLVKSHDCLKKKCNFFERINPEYWEALEIAEIEKRNTRLLAKQERLRINDRNTFIKLTLEDSGNIYVTSVRNEPKYLLTITYIFDKRVDLSEEAKFLRKSLKKAIRLQARTGTDETIEQLIRKRRRETRKVTDLRKAPKVGTVTKKRLNALGVHCLEDLYGRNGDHLYRLDCELSGGKVNRRFLTAYRSAVAFINDADLVLMKP